MPGIQTLCSHKVKHNVCALAAPIADNLRMKLIDEIEKYRSAKGLGQDDMVRIFGLPTRQNYDNWVRRKSIPKNYIDKAKQLLGYEEVNTGAEVTVRGWIPLISWVQAGEWSEAIDIYEPGYAEETFPTAVNHSKTTFALRVEGDSMTLPEGVQGRSFPHGMIIYVDPERDSEIGDFVVARLPTTGHATFKKFGREEGRSVLVPQNPDRSQYPVIRDEFELIGRVIDAGWGGL